MARVLLRSPYRNCVQWRLLSQNSPLLCRGMGSQQKSSKLNFWKHFVCSVTYLEERGCVKLWKFLACVELEEKSIIITLWTPHVPVNWEYWSFRGANGMSACECWSCLGLLLEKQKQKMLELEADGSKQNPRANRRTLSPACSSWDKSVASEEEYT